MLSRDLTHVLNTAIAFLVECRPLSLSMGNAIKALKLQVHTPSEDPSLSTTTQQFATLDARTHRQGHPGFQGFDQVTARGPLKAALMGELLESRQAAGASLSQV